MNLLQVIINGLTNGLIIGLLGLAFAAVYLPTGVFHLALGGLCVVAPLVLSSFLTWNAPWYVAAPIAIVVCSALSVSCESFNHSRLFRRGASPAAHLLSSLGIYILLVHVASMIWGDQTRVLSTVVDSAWSCSWFTVTRSQGVVALFGAVFIAAYYSLLHKSGLGLRFRAMAANPTEAALRGINVPRLRILAFAIAGFLAGLAGVLSSLDKGFRPQLGGLSALTLAIVAFIVGGRHSFWGPLYGGLIVGVLRSATEVATSSQWLDAVSYLLLLVFLLAMPNGLLGRAARLESEQ